MITDLSQIDVLLKEHELRIKQLERYMPVVKLPRIIRKKKDRESFYRKQLLKSKPQS